MDRPKFSRACRGLSGQESPPHISNLAGGAPARNELSDARARSHMTAHGCVCGPARPFEGHKWS